MSRLSKRNLTLDVVRIIAVLSVIMFHCSGTLLQKENKNDVNYFIGNLIFGISCIGVPLFLMISGALLLDEDRPFCIKNFMRKNLLTIFILTLIWGFIYSLIYTVFKPLLSHNTISIKHFILTALWGYSHMWYLYMLIGIYLFLPFMRCFVKKDNHSLALLFIILSLSTQFIIPVFKAISIYYKDFEFFISYIEKFEANYFGSYLAYFIAGWYLVHIDFNQKWKRNLLYLSGVICFIVAFIYAQITKDYINLYRTYGIPVFFYATSIFLLLTRKIKPVSATTSATISLLSKLTFAVYLIHPIIQSVLRNIIPKIPAPALEVFLHFFGVTLLSYLIAYVLSKLPGIKKLIRM